ncbi:YraN family protein [Brevibacterium oceani]|uniref:YraN family protein n=1 Tax=Brevibacterium oceani TaxID=358099 RepID=UPI002159C800|nr:YraN family protein [Brevibacterium oceani]
MGQRRTAGRAPTARGMRKQALGEHGEDLAAAFLEAAGLVIIERNFRCPRGELDIIARDGDTAVFVEVKTRRTGALGSPLEAVTASKLGRIRTLAGIWLSGQDEFFPTTRIDALGIIIEPSLQYFHCPNIQVDS